MTSKENLKPVAGNVLDNVIASNPSTIYLFKEKKANVAYQEFKRLLEEGYEGLCITRSPPNQIRDRFDLGTCPIIWLTGNKPQGYETLAPNEISKLASLITKFINPNANNDASMLKRVVILDNIEYLIMQNNFPTILRVLHLVRDKIMLSSAIMLIPIDPLSIDFKELRLIEREAEVVDVKDY